MWGGETLNLAGHTDAGRVVYGARHCLRIAKPTITPSENLHVQGASHSEHAVYRKRKTKIAAAKLGGVKGQINQAPGRESLAKLFMCLQPESLSYLLLHV